MTTAQNGNTVKVHYTGKLHDGTVFDSSVKRNEPLEFTLGQGNMIAGFEKAVLGMEVGESKVADIPAQEAYGSKSDDMVIEVPRQEVPDDIKPEVGQQLAIKQNDGRTVPVTVTDISEESIVLDGNHPLAGKDLLFEIELVEIR